MCGRFALTEIPGELIEDLALFPPAFSPRYNIAPTQNAPVVFQEYSESPSLQSMRWGLIPYWADDKSIGARCINARAETAASKPAFKGAFASRRCLVPASGFYEWKRGEGNARTPYYCTPAVPGEPLVFAGLWERWRGHGEEVRSFTILTCPANAFMAALHDRMPAILPRIHWKRWLDPEVKDHDGLQAMLSPDAGILLQYRQVGPAVNNAAVDCEECILEAEESA